MPQRPFPVLAALLAGLLSTACEDVTVREDRRALLAVDREFAGRTATQGFRVMEDFYAEDAIYLPSFAPTLEGRDKILESYRPYYDSATMKLVWTPTRADVARSRDLGWTIGTYEFTRIDDEGKTVVRRGRYVTIWRKQNDGSWKAVLDSGSPDERTPSPDAPAAEPASPPSGGAARPAAGSGDRP